MKKLIALLVMVMSLGLSSLGLASPASDALKTEEQAVDAVMKVLTSNTDLATVETYFTPELKKNFTAAALKTTKKNVEDQIGKISDLKLYQLRRFDNADELVYVGKANKSPNARVVVIFDTKGRNPMMNGLVIMPADIQRKSSRLRLQQAGEKQEIIKCERSIWRKLFFPDFLLKGLYEVFHLFRLLPE